MEPQEKTFDAIVIGSGIGGLAAAGLLTRHRDMRVLVLEKHFEIGGLTHVFSRGRYKWDVGLHYVGKMGVGDLPRILFDYITDGRLGWNKIKSPFERLIYPDFSFAIPDSRSKYEKDLAAQFPEQRTVIHQYFKDVFRVARWWTRFFLAGFLPEPLSFLLRLVNIPTRKIAMTTLKDWFDTHGVTDQLRALLSSQWGDYGATPGESSFAIHATVVRHYISGGYFPQEHSNQIATTVEQVIEAHGGMVLINREVTEVILDNGKAIGVRVDNTALLDARKEEYFAPIVISDAPAPVLYGKLLPKTVAQKAIPDIEDLEHGCSAVTVYLGLKDTPLKLGVNGENFWINTTEDHEDLSKQTDAVMRGEPIRCFVSFPSIRGGRTEHHTAEIIALVKYEPFRKWKGQKWRERDPDYYALKNCILEGLLDLADRHITGLKEMIAFKEMSTPITMEYFTNRPYGAMYGYKPNVKRFQKTWFKPQTPVKGLYQAGSDVCCAGIAGGLLGGLAAASAVTGELGLVRIVASARIWKRTFRRGRAKALRQPEGFRTDSDKILAPLVKKVALTDTVYEFTYGLPRPVEFLPGQFAKIMYGLADYGSYSIVGSDGTSIRFLIDTKFGGMYADYFRGIKEGDTSVIRLPIGDFLLKQTTNHKVFFSTGTGITPFLPMLAVLARSDHEEDVDFYFGCRYARDNFIGPYLEDFGGSLRLSSRVYVSGEKVEGTCQGRITDALDQYATDPESYDFYVSGNPAMIRDVTDGLRERGATNVFYENY